MEWAHVCLTEAIEPPATTNHTQQYGPVHGLWTAALHDAALGADGTHWRRREAIMPNEQQPAATALLRRLRWAALGTPYDWSSRSYVPQADIRAVAAPFTELAHRMCSALIGHQLRGDVALVNLYGTGCTLSGHVDDAEADGCETAPVVSISLGVPGVLLLQNATASGDGGTAVTPLLLRSGDVVVLSGPARRARHGVPRVFTPGDTAPSKAAAHDAATAALLAASAAAHGHGNTHGECGGVSDGAVDAVCISPPVCACSLACVPAWLHHNRINISIRDMEPGARLAAG